MIDRISVIFWVLDSWVCWSTAWAGLAGQVDLPARGCCRRRRTSCGCRPPCARRSETSSPGGRSRVTTAWRACPSADVPWSLTPVTSGSCGDRRLDPGDGGVFGRPSGARGGGGHQHRLRRRRAGERGRPGARPRRWARWTAGTASCCSSRRWRSREGRATRQRCRRSSAATTSQRKRTVTRPSEANERRRSDVKILQPRAGPRVGQVGECGYFGPNFQGEFRPCDWSIRTRGGSDSAAGSRRGMGTAVSGQRLRLTRASRWSRATAAGSSSPGRVSTAPSAIIPPSSSRPLSVRTMVSVQSWNDPIPPVEMSACSAAKSGHEVHPSRVQAWASLRGISWNPPSRVQTWKTPLMFILAMSARAIPYLASNSSGKMASSNVFEHSSPMVSDRRRAILPALRACMIGGAEAWQPMPTRAIRSAPPSMASG